MLHSDEWRAFWSDLGFEIESFESLGLSPNASDRELWEMCQRNEVILITDNRNADGADALQTIIDAETTDESLPVLTIANAVRVTNSRDYSERVVLRLLEYLYELELLRGTGRLYLP